MRRSFILAAVVTSLLVVPFAAPSAKPPKSSDLTISVTPNPVTFGQNVAVSGKLKGAKAGITVTLQKKPAPYSGAFKDVTTTTTQTNGDYRFSGIGAPLNTRYRAIAATAPPTVSPEVLLSVRIKVVLRLSDYTPRAGQRVRFYGTAAPEHDGRLAYIQRRTSTGRWRTVAMTGLLDAGTDFSKFSRRIRVRRDGTYRVRVFHDSDHADGTSRTKFANVH